MPRTSEPGKSVYFEIGIWYNEAQDNIHITAKGVDGFHTTVSADHEKSPMRGHPNLFKKLANILRDNGAPAPKSGSE